MHDLFPRFIVYSFLGFLLEVAYARWRGDGGKGRKALLFLPLCPVYGLGALAILGMPPLLLDSPVAVFVAGGLLATLVELAFGLFYRAVGVQFWDYQDQAAHVAGLICPRFTLYWGALAVGLVYLVHPLVVSPILDTFPTGLSALLFPAFGADLLAALWLLHRTGTPESLRWYRAFRPNRGTREAM